MKKIIRPICTLLFGVAVILFFGLAYPHHLHYQEQFQLFLFDSAYVWEMVKLPGGTADLLGRFCTQFFLFAWVGAIIIGLLLSAMQLLTARLAKCGWFYGLSFVPSFLLWLFLLDENALLGGVWAVVLTLLASWGFDRLTDGWTRRILLVAAVPILYWVAGPVCVLFFLLQVLHHKRSAWSYGVFLLLIAMPVISSCFLPVPASSLWTGIHYHRYPTVFPALLWAATLSVFVLTLIVRAFYHQRSKKFNGQCSTVNEKNGQCPKMRVNESRDEVVQSMPSNSILGEANGQWSMFNGQWSTLSVFVVVAVIMGWVVWKNSNFKAEKVMQYDFMARHQQWNRILDTVNAEKPNNPIGVTVQNLALAMHGLLPDHLFEYNQNGISGLFPDVNRDATSPLPTAEVFYQLGMINVAQRSVFEAQEAILDFQKSARCYKRLAQTNLINGDYEVARKYLMALQKTLLYSEWANETLPLLGDEEAIAKHPEYGRLRKVAYKDDFYFSDQTTFQMLQSLFLGNTDNRLAYEYLLAYCLLTGDRENYYYFTSYQQ